ncbi:MAG: type VI secretion system protein TssA [Gammaproteobacteria bacterium]|nr:type VI secretion system protein TssA [Gammaproteobacteria bacterium]
MNKINEHALAAIGEKPINESTPCGENVRYEAVFEELEAELAKQESLNSETVDWKRVAELSSNILKDSSKDLLVGAYLTQALLINEGYSGLSVGLKILNDMVENHWDCLFPPAKRMRARATAISWLAERAGTLISEKSPTSTDASAVVDAAKYIRLLDNELAEKMGDDAPIMSDLSRPLKNYKQSADAEMANATAAVAAPIPATEELAQQSQDAQSSAVPEKTTPAPVSVAKSRPEKSKVSVTEVGDIASDNDAKKVLKGAQDAVRKVSSYWSVSKLSDAKAYRMARVAAWMMIEISPPANEGVTQVLPPAAERIKFFEAQIEKGEYSSVLPELEKTLARAPFWIDGQNMVVTVLRAMGGEYEKAATAVIGELQHLLQRIPDLLDLSFSDQTPFVSDQTRMWLESEVLTSATESSSAVTKGDTSNAWDDALVKSRKLVSSGDKEAALKIFNEGIAAAAQVRDKFYWRCALAELLLQTGEAVAASNLLKAMTNQVEVYHLTEWEPDLLSRIYKLLYQSYRKQQSKKKDDSMLGDLVESTYVQLCWFDPISALTVKGEK